MGGYVNDRSGVFLRIYAAEKKFYRQLSPGLNNRKALELFEKWLKGYVGANAPTPKQQLNKNKLSVLLDRAVAETSKILNERGIKINCVCLPVLVNKSTCRCLRVQTQSSVYYRIRKTSPRKGKYKGQNLISIELVADGNKNNVFIPLMAQKETMERELNRPIERESKAVEETGKYRLKVLFKNFYADEEKNFKELTDMMTDFIFVTNSYLQKLPIVPVN